VTASSIAARAAAAGKALERIGTPEAQAVLKDLANGALKARLSKEAKSSLERLAKRPVTQP